MGDRSATIYVYCGRTVVHRPKSGAAVSLFGRWGAAGPVAWVKAYLCTKWHLDPSSRLATTDMDRTLGDCAPFCWHLDLSSRLATTDMGENWGLCAPSGEGS